MNKSLPVRCKPSRLNFDSHSAFIGVAWQTLKRELQRFGNKRGSSRELTPGEKVFPFASASDGNPDYRNRFKITKEDATRGTQELFESSMAKIFAVHNDLLMPQLTVYTPLTLQNLKLRPLICSSYASVRRRRMLKSKKKEQTRKDRKNL